MTGEGIAAIISKIINNASKVVVVHDLGSIASLLLSLLILVLTFFVIIVVVILFFLFLPILFLDI
jgi:hypothetical protein